VSERTGRRQPARGEVWAANLNPRRGRGQAGQRPVVVISEDVLNQGPAGELSSTPLNSFSYDFHARRSVIFQEEGNVMSDTALMMQYDANKKSALVAYVLWCFMGLFGAHRFYLGEKGTGAGMLIITLASLVLMFVFTGFFTIFITIIWAFVDLFLIPGMTRKYNNDLAVRLGVVSDAAIPASPPSSPSDGPLA